MVIRVQIMSGQTVKGKTRENWSSVLLLAYPSRRVLCRRTACTPHLLVLYKTARRAPKREKSLLQDSHREGERMITPERKQRPPNLLRLQRARIPGALLLTLRWACWASTSKLAQAKKDVGTTRGVSCRTRWHWHQQR